MKAYLLRHLDGARDPAAVVYALSATAAHQQHAVLDGATFATTTVERAPSWDGHAPDGPTLGEVLAAHADATTALDGEGGEGTLADRVRAVVAEVRRLRALGPLRSCTDAEITEALRASGGRYTGAARLLGISPGSVHERVQNHPEIRPEGVPTFGPGRPRGRTQVAKVDAAREERAEEARRAVEAHGTPAAAARALGVTRQTISNRLAWAEREAA